MNADVLADLLAIIRPPLQALARGPRGRAEAAFARLEVDLARWAVQHGVTPETLDRLGRTLREEDAVRQAFHTVGVEPHHVRSGGKRR